MLKEHVALDRSSWSLKNVCYKMHMVRKMGLKVEYNDPQKIASKLRGFPFTLRTYTVGHLLESKI